MARSRKGRDASFDFVADDGTVYALSALGRLHALAAETGERLWSREELMSLGENVYATQCATCHQADGSMEGIPSIVGWPEEDFVVAMHAYKNKQRSHPVMQMIAGRLNDEEIAALAAYFQSFDN